MWTVALGRSVALEPGVTVAWRAVAEPRRFCSPLAGGQVVGEPWSPGTATSRTDLGQAARAAGFCPCHGRGVWWSDAAVAGRWRGPGSSGYSGWTTVGSADGLLGELPWWLAAALGISPCRWIGVCWCLAWSCVCRRGGATQGLSCGEAGWRDGRRRRARATRRRQRGVPVVDASAPTPPFPRPCVCFGVVRGRTYVAVSSVGCVRWPKVGHFGRSWGCLDVGRREAPRSWAELASRVRASSHGHAGGWSLVVGGGVGVLGYITCPIVVLADGGGGRGRRILHEGSVAVSLLLRDALGENTIFKIIWWRL